MGDMKFYSTTHAYVLDQAFFCDGGWPDLSERIDLLLEEMDDRPSFDVGDYTIHESTVLYFIPDVDMIAEEMYGSYAQPDHLFSDPSLNRLFRRADHIETTLGKNEWYHTVSPAPYVSNAEEEFRLAIRRAKSFEGKKEKLTIFIPRFMEVARLMNHPYWFGGKFPEWRKKDNINVVAATPFSEGDELRMYQKVFQ